MWLIRCPVFLLLILVAVGKDERKANAFLNYCLKLCRLSDINLVQLHNGHLDLILLSFLKNERLKYAGIDFELRASRHLVVEVLTRIISIASDSVVAREFICDNV
jgi:hypothetical protein